MRLFLLILLIWPMIGWAGESSLNKDARKSHPDHPEENGLRLEVNATLDDSLSSDGITWKWGGAFLHIEIALHNVSQAPITVPTTAFDKGPTVVQWPGWGESTERIMFFIDSPTFQGKPAAYAPSRFSPVTLAPGEYALVLRHVAVINDRKHADSIKEASVLFNVSSQFVGPKEWWRGNLQTYASIKRPQDPDKEIEERTASDQCYRAELADPNFFRNVPARVAALIASADHVGFRGEDEKKNKEVIFRDPEWIRRLSEAVANVSVTSRVSCLCSGWRTAYFYKGDERVVSLAAIHGNQLRIYWKESGGDFPIDAAQWKMVSTALKSAQSFTPSKSSTASESR